MNFIRAHPLFKNIMTDDHPPPQKKDSWISTYYLEYLEFKTQFCPKESDVRKKIYTFTMIK